MVEDQVSVLGFLNGRRRDGQVDRCDGQKFAPVETGQSNHGAANVTREPCRTENVFGVSAARDGHKYISRAKVGLDPLQEPVFIALVV